MAGRLYKGGTVTLYYHDQKVAIDIIDDPLVHHFEGDETGWTVFRVTMAELMDFDTHERIMNEVAKALGVYNKEYQRELDRYEDRRRALHHELYDNDFMRCYASMPDD